MVMDGNLCYLNNRTPWSYVDWLADLLVVNRPQFLGIYGYYKPLASKLAGF